MRFLFSTLFLLGLPAAALAAEESGTPLAVVQKLFDAMAKHDAEGAKKLFVLGSSLVSVRPDGTVATTPFEKFAERIGTSKDAWLERIWNPKVMEHREVAVVWAEYDFYLNGKFGHCGIDSFSLLKTSGGWKISSVADTREVKGCAPSPLGPPSK